MKNSLTLLFVLVGLSACGPRHTQETSNASTEVRQPQESADAEMYRLVDPERIEALNQAILSQGLGSPEAILAAYAPKDPEAEGNYSYTHTMTDVTGGRKEITLVEEGLMDDSMSGRKLIMTLAPDGAGWKVVALKETYKCWPGRGHEDWGAAPCQ